MYARVQLFVNAQMDRQCIDMESEYCWYIAYIETCARIDLYLVWVSFFNGISSWVNQCQSYPCKRTAVKIFYP